MPTETTDLSAFTARHVAGAARLSAAEGWPHRAEDWAALLALGRGLVALRGDAVAGTGLCFPFGPGAARLGMIIVDGTIRGQGLGRRLTEGLIALAGDRALSLCATADGLPLYERLGFEAAGEIRQHQGIAAPLPAAGAPDWAAEADAEEIAALDRTASGMDRGALVRHLLGAGRIALHRPAGRIEGYAALRPFGRGHVAGPLVAPDAETARGLLAPLVAACAGTFLRVDTGADTGLSPWLAARGMPQTGGATAMQRGALPPAGDARIFAIASQALG